MSLNRAWLVSLVPCLAFTGASVSGARAAAVIDFNAGTLVDDLSTNEYLDAGASSGTQLVGGALVLANPGFNGFATTRTVTPVSFYKWRALYFAWSGSSLGNITATFQSDAGSVVLSIVPSDDPAYGAMALVPVEYRDAAASPSARVRFDLTKPAAGQVAPAIDRYKLTWDSKSLVKLQHKVDAQACSGANVLHTFDVSVSFVTAEDLVITVPIPTGASTDLPSQVVRLVPRQILGGQGGFSGPAGVTLPNGTFVDPDHAWFMLGDVAPGSTFKLQYTTTIPLGTLAGTTFTATAQSAAGNAEPRSATATVTTTGGAAPVIRKTVSGAVYDIGGTWYADPGATLTYNLRVENLWAPTCRETFHQVVVEDDLAGVLGHATNLRDVSGGVTLAGGKLTWALGTLAPGAVQNLSFTLDVAPGSGGALLHNEADLFSTLPAQAERDDDALDVRIGIPYTPSGIVAKGQRVRGIGGANAIFDDAPTQTVTYGESFEFLLAFANRGFSTLDTLTAFDRVPEGLSFESASIGWNVSALEPEDRPQIWYYRGAQDHPAIPPETDFAGFDPLEDDVDGDLMLDNWSTTPPANPADVTWFAVVVPRLASPYVAGSVPSSLEVAITVAVDPPQLDACDGGPFLNTTTFDIWAYREVGGVRAATPGSLRNITEQEPGMIAAITPAFEDRFVSPSPTTLVGTGTIDYRVYFRNFDYGASATDTALTPVVTIQLPRTSINGVQKYLGVVDVTAGPGADIDTSLAATQGIVTVAYPFLAAGEAADIRVYLDVPRGVLFDAQLPLTATIQATDDYCGPVLASATGTARAVVSPYLKLTKDTSLEVANYGATVDYALSYLNIGPGAARGALVCDQIPDHVRFLSMSGPSGARFFFSADPGVAVPSDVLAFDFTRAQLEASPAWVGVPGGPNVASPFGDATTWVCAGVDVPGLDPPQLPPDGQVRQISVRVEVLPDAQVPDDAVIYDQALIDSDELLPAISNLVDTTIAGDPSLVPERDCAPSVFASGERVTITSTYTNRSTNVDVAADVTERLDPRFVRASFLLTVTTPTGTIGPLGWDDLAGAGLGVLDDEEGVGVGFTANLIALRGGWLLQGEQVSFTMSFVLSGLTTGQEADFDGTGTATSGTDPGAGNGSSITVQSSCTLVAANPDLRIAKLASIQNPVSGDVVTYTIAVTNAGLHRSSPVEIIDELPDPGTTYLGPTTLLSPEGTIGQPTAAGLFLTWRGITWLGEPGLPPGATLRFSYRVQIGQGGTTPTFGSGVSLTNCAEVAQYDAGDGVFEEEPGANNRDCETVVTPKPDLRVVKSGPALALAGEVVRYELEYTNLTRQPAPHATLFDGIADLLPPSPTPDSVPDMTVRSVRGDFGEQVYYSALAARPDFDPANPTLSGAWSASPSGHVRWIAIYAGTLPGLSAPRRVVVDLELRAPNGTLPFAGNATRNCVEGVLATTPATEERSTGNQANCVTTQVPGLDVAVDKVCGAPCGTAGAAADCIDPYGEVRPEDPILMRITLRNAGTEIARGLTLTDVMPVGFVPVLDTADTIVVTTGSGGPSAVVNGSGVALTGARWTRVGDTWVLGSTTPGARDHFLAVGLLPGDETSILVTGTAASWLPNRTTITNTVVAAADATIQEEEEYLVNNTSSCDVIVRRPDMVVGKALLYGAEDGEADVGEQLTWQISVDNVGDGSADNVVMSDLVPAGTVIFPKSFTELPEGATLVFYDRNGDAVTPNVGLAETDPTIGSFEVRIPKASAPMTPSFVEDDAFEGDFSGTYGAGGQVRPTVNEGTVSYMTPEIGGEVTVIGWKRARVDASGADLGADAGPSIVVDVVDENADPIPGYVGLPVNQPIDLTGIDVTTHTTLYVVTRFEGVALAEGATLEPLGGGGGVGGEDQGGIVTHLTQDRAAGILYRAGYNHRVGVWRHDSEGEPWTVEELPGPVGVQGRVAQIHAFDGDDLAASFIVSAGIDELGQPIDTGMMVVLYRDVGDGWTVSAVDVGWGSEVTDASICEGACPEYCEALGCPNVVLSTASEYKVVSRAPNGVATLTPIGSYGSDTCQLQYVNANGVIGGVCNGSTSRWVELWVMDGSGGWDYHELLMDGGGLNPHGEQIRYDVMGVANSAVLVSDNETGDDVMHIVKYLGGDPSQLASWTVFPSTYEAFYILNPEDDHGYFYTYFANWVYVPNEAHPEGWGYDAVVLEVPEGHHLVDFDGYLYTGVRAASASGSFVGGLVHDDWGYTEAFAWTPTSQGVYEAEPLYSGIVTAADATGPDDDAWGKYEGDLVGWAQRSWGYNYYRLQYGYEMYDGDANVLASAAGRFGGYWSQWDDSTSNYLNHPVIWDSANGFGDEEYIDMTVLPSSSGGGGGGGATGAMVWNGGPEGPLLGLTFTSDGETWTTWSGDPLEPAATPIDLGPNGASFSVVGQIGGVPILQVYDSGDEYLRGGPLMPDGLVELRNPAGGSLELYAAYEQDVTWPGVIWGNTTDWSYFYGWYPDGQGNYPVFADGEPRPEAGNRSGRIKVANGPHVAGSVFEGSSIEPAVFDQAIGEAALDDFHATVLPTPAGYGDVLDVIDGAVLGYVRMPDYTTFKPAIWTLDGPDRRDPDSWTLTVIDEPIFAFGSGVFARLVGPGTPRIYIHDTYQSAAAVVFEPDGAGGYVRVAVPSPGVEVGDRRAWHSGIMTTQLFIKGTPVHAVLVKSAIEAVYEPLTYGTAYGDIPARYVAPGRVIAPVDAGEMGPTLTLVQRSQESGVEVFQPLYGENKSFYGTEPIAASDSGVFLAWVFDEWELTYQAYAFVPDVGGYAAVPLGVAYYDGGAPYDAPGVWLGGTCFAINPVDADGFPTVPYLWGCSADVAVDRIEVAYATVERPTFTYETRVDDTCKSEIVNTVDVVTTTLESDLSNNAATARTGFARADLAAAITVDTRIVDPSAEPPEALTYTVRVENRGPSRADGAKVVVTFPADIDIGVIANPYTLDLGALEAGQVVQQDFGPFEVTTDLAEAQLRAEARVSSQDADCGPDNDTASALSIVSAEPNVWITKSGPASVRVGETITWTLAWGNDGNADAEGVSVIDVWPGEQRAFAIDVLAAGASGGTQISTVVEGCGLVGRQLVNTATISADFDLDGSDNSAAVSTLVLPPAAQLAVDVVPSRAEVALGEAVTWTIHARNTGTAPTGPFSIVAGASGMDLMAPLTPSWDFAGLAPGQATSVSVTGVANGLAPALVADAIVAPGTGGAICPFEVTSSATLLHDSTSDPSGLVIVKSADTQLACGEGTIRWTLEVAKRGWAAEDSDDVVVIDALPAGLAYVAGSITGPGGKIVGLPTLRWDVGRLRPGEHVTLGYETTAPSGAAGFVTNTAEVRDGDVAEGVSNPAEVRVDCTSALQVDKAIAAACGADLGDPVTFTVTYRNRGASSLTNVVIHDVLGDDWYYEGSSVPGAEPLGGELTVPLGTLAPGAEGAFTISLSPHLIGAGDIATNRLTATADGMAPQTSNQVALGIGGCDDGDPCTSDTCLDGGRCVYAEIPGCGDTTNVKITKSGPATVTAGEDVSWTLEVTNTSVIVAGHIVVTDTLPAGFTLVGEGVFQLASLGPGTSQTFTVTATAPAGCEDLGSFTNTATVTADGDGDPNDDTATADIQVVADTTVVDLCDGVDDDCDGLEGEDDGCDDLVECTVDACVAGACEHTVDHDYCDDGAWCDGAEWCDPLAGCQDEAAPCAEPTPFCDEGSDTCVECETDGDCDDGLYCNGVETCMGGTCEIGSDPCMGTDEPYCDETMDACVECQSDEHCGDGVFCNGAETCDASGACESPGDPCAGDPDLPFCDETGDACVECRTVADCPVSGEPCGVAACSGGACDVVPGNEGAECRESGGVCDVAEHCDGSSVECPADTFLAGEVCNPSSGVCDPEERCDGESADCPADVFADDGDPCPDDTVCNGEETCLLGECVSGEPLVCADDDQCDGAETCDDELGCVDGEAVVIDDGVDCTTDACDPATGDVTHTPDDGLCEDDDACTTDRCDPEDGCVNEPFVSEQVACGTGDCATIVGSTTCDPETGEVTDDCDEILAGLVEICDGDDDDCDGEIDEGFDVDCGPGLVYYAIVEDEQGQAVGTIRCFKDTTSGALDCSHQDDDPATFDVDESQYLEVFDGLLCPAVAP
ncbi:MAG: DUF11 domain-containing protein [Deltaproteobacteria bacterium]|nr:DUF11 domain-containing protein [Deltaproteobacteria bacterium]